MTTRVRPRGSNHIGMGQFNERVVLHSLRIHGELPKSELARLTGLTAQTVGIIATRLEEQGLLKRQDPLRGRIGQPRVPLALNSNGAYTIGVKIGRRHCDCLLVDFCGKVQRSLHTEYPFPHAEQLFPWLQKSLASLVQMAPVEPQRIVGVGVAAPFFLGGWHSRIKLSDAQADYWNKIDLLEQVQNLTDLPVSMVRDTNAACVAELITGCGKEIKNFLYLFVDTFVGGGLVLDSRPYFGRHGNAAAVASLPLRMLPLRPQTQPFDAADDKAPEQLLTSASLWELEVLYRENGLDPTAAYDDRATQGAWQAHTQNWLHRAAQALAHSAICGMAILDVPSVVIDGAMDEQLRAQLIAATRQAMQQYNWEGIWQPSISPGSLGGEAIALGGALLPLYQHFVPDHEVFLKE